MFKLPEGMERVWLMRAKGMREVEIAEAQGISRQAVNKALKDAREKLFENFLGIAEVFSFEVIRINVEKGFMIANAKIGSEVKRAYFFYIPKIGVRAFFEDSEFPDYLLEHAIKLGLAKNLSKDELLQRIEI
ncbi:RNA polymerase sigma factor sigma-70 region 4 domain-containing protein [Thermococcus sp.]